MVWLESVVNFINDYMSGYILVILLVGVGLFYSIKTKFVQIRCFGEGFKQVFGKKKGRVTISPSQTVSHVGKLRRRIIA